LSPPDSEAIVPTKEREEPQMLNERDLEVAHKWIQEYVLEDGVHDFDDAEEEGNTVKSS
jgi:hypothetical protein